MGPFSRVPLFATFASNAAVLEWSLALSLGFSLCFANTPQALIGDYLADVIDKNPVTHMHLTPNVLGTLPASRRLQSLECISVGREMVPDNLIERWRKRVTLQNAYGPTEATVVMAHRPQPSSLGDILPSTANIGKPHSPTEVFVCNLLSTDRWLSTKSERSLRLACNWPEGVHPFELPQSARAEADAWAPGNAYCLPRLSLNTSDKMDHKVIKLRMEELIRDAKFPLGQRHPSARAQTKTILANEPVSHQELTNIWVDLLALKSAPSRQSSFFDLGGISLLAQTLIERLCFDDFIPCVQSRAPAKITAPRVKPPRMSRRSSTKSFAPGSDVDTVSGVTNIWESVLQLDRVQVNASFFDAGGNSLLMTTSHKSMVQSWPGCGVQLNDLFQNATIQSQAGFIRVPSPAHSAAPSLKARKNRASATGKKERVARKESAGPSGEIPNQIP
ncbi:unnamed protein product [Mycena citricolor]|uniref:Carrier domain-containing protein n=1 Tax=Mycena citricolor TaxID=2018698 RepID=A0AAD2K0Q9_9AGAR|nr:unnamed protein product [Mycena citricolor]